MLIAFFLKNIVKIFYKIKFLLGATNIISQTPPPYNPIKAIPNFREVLTSRVKSNPYINNDFLLYHLLYRMQTIKEDSPSRGDFQVHPALPRGEGRGLSDVRLDDGC